MTTQEQAEQIRQMALHLKQAIISFREMPEVRQLPGDAPLTYMSSMVSGAGQVARSASELMFRCLPRETPASCIPDLPMLDEVR